MPRQNIIQRRASGRSSATLPITHNDIRTESGKRRHRQRFFSLSVSPYDRLSIIRWAILIAISMAAAILWKPILPFFGSKSQSAPGHHRRELDVSSSSHHAAQLSLPLSQFSDLSYALENSDLLALYFAASWCPMSTPVSLALDGAFGEKDALLSHRGGKKTLSVVYVSSDKTLEEYDGYLQNRNWMAIPFESQQRSQLKRHFSTCAHRELEELGIDRKHEIPTIIVIDSQTQGILTTNGANDVDQMGVGALNHWKKMQSWVRKTAAAVDVA